MKNISATLICFLCASCASKPAPEISPAASCLQKQNFCLDRCAEMHETELLGQLLGTLAARPKTQQQKENVQKYSQQEDSRRAAEKKQCRETCDKKADVCRSNIR